MNSPDADNLRRRRSRLRFFLIFCLCIFAIGSAGAALIRQYLVIPSAQIVADSHNRFDPNAASDAMGEYRISLWLYFSSGALGILALGLALFAGAALKRTQKLPHQPL